MGKIIRIFLPLALICSSAYGFTVENIRPLKNPLPMDDPIRNRHGVVIEKHDPSFDKKLVRNNLIMKQDYIIKECVTECNDIETFWIDYLQNLKHVPLLVYQDFSKMHLSFPYKGIPFVAPNDVLVNVGTNSAFEDVKGSMVFGGVIQVFVHAPLKTLCSFSISNIEKSLYFIDEANVTTLINGKITQKMTILGKNKLGYLYNVVWYDAKYSYSLMCSKYELNTKNRNELIDFAKQIDTALNMG